MHFSLLISALVSLTANLALAAPMSVQAPAPFEIIDQDTISSSSRLRKRNVGGVRLCTGSTWTVSCDYVIWPLNECVALNDYASNVLSFRPDADTECYLMQGRCNADEEYADLFNDSQGLGDLGTLSWIANANSYICMTPLVLSS